ncbi:MAG: hypothetical protein QXN53_07965 [Thermoproteota archaeon]
MSSKPVLRVLSTKISFHLKHILFPIDLRELTEVLSGLGYAIPPQTLQALPGPGMIEISYMVGSGPIAKKGNLLVDINSDRGFIGVGGQSIPDVILSFEEVEKAICNNFGIDPNTDIRFYEILARLDCEVENNILESMSKISDGALFTRLGKIIGKMPILYGIRLVPKGAVPNQEEWFDITIQPHLYKPNQVYQISVIYRSADRNNVLATFKNLEEIILKIIKELQT